MKTKGDEVIIEAFTATSSDEPHHCENGFEYVDRVALSTNRFYVIDSLHSRRTAPSLRELVSLAESMDMPQALLRFGRELSLSEAAFVSFYRHCLIHFGQSRILRAAYLIKAMSKVLSETRFYDYVDLLDPDLAHAYETIAYDAQVDRSFSGGIPEELRIAILEYLGKDEEKLRADKECSFDLINGREHSLLKSHDSSYYSHLLASVYVPIIATLINLDRSELLSQFTYGIISIFEPIPPQIYFVGDLSTLSHGRLGNCNMLDVAKFPYPIDDIVIFSTEDIEENTRIKRTQQSYVGLAYETAISGLWRNTLRGLSCPCSYGETCMTRCPCEKPLYRAIRNFFVRNSTLRRKVSEDYAEVMKTMMGTKDPLSDRGAELLSKNGQITKFRTSVFHPIPWRIANSEDYFFARAKSLIDSKRKYDRPF